MLKSVVFILGLYVIMVVSPFIAKVGNDQVKTDKISNKLEFYSFKSKNISTKKFDSDSVEGMTTEEIDYILNMRASLK